MAIDIHFTEADWERMARTWSAWWAGELSRPIVMIEGYANDADASRFQFANSFIPFRFPLGSSVDAVVDHFQTELEARRYFGDAWPRWWPNFGPGIAAGFLGANVIPFPDTVWFEPDQAPPIASVHPDFDATNAWWRYVYEVTRRAVARWNGHVCVGLTDLGGNLDLIASLCTTEQLLYDLLDHPAEVARLCATITRLWQRYYDELDAVIAPMRRGSTPWAPIWSPGRTYMLQSDFAYMISPQMFETYVLPDLEACCASLDHAFYHLDGSGQIVHLDLLLSLENLHGIQWIPGAGAPPPEEWLSLLQRIRACGKLCQLYVSPNGARRIVRELGGQGFALFIDEPMREGEATAFLKLLQSEDGLLAT
jgi:5-methyltetrahydrofolate--homocysteine methyltransferase